MNECLLCGQEFVAPVSFLQLLSVQRIKTANLCPACRKKFTRLTNVRCQICSKNLRQAGICNDCLAWQQIYGENLLHNFSLYRYNEFFHDLMVNYKRYGDYVLHTVLQELCQSELVKIKTDLYVPVPTAPEHIEKRQFDTVSAIYQEIVPLTFLLVKKAGGGAQGEKNKRERMLSKQNFFMKENKLPADFAGKILLLDDIYTTGRTLYHARDKLLEAFPNAEINSFSICR